MQAPADAVRSGALETPKVCLALGLTAIDDPWTVNNSMMPIDVCERACMVVFMFLCTSQASLPWYELAWLSKSAQMHVASQASR